ncbi:MAG: DUF1015 domain-containing protein [Candidatus Mcinerneyibacterium aminivorans]|uniref:DUF1015 domain-containing protein n=1 Tax=Candidatus Mcinerneyibacterium aminivorans TaxID=2703815 RepID=A0A5D0MAW3_9BACT|nr:MAG: DUF1015 domain-containing protein [Candidatus Mcinerneyibacterium aminivorans]
MAELKPFKGLRPKENLVDEIASPPYDVLDSEEAREKVKDNPYSFLHVVKPEVDLPRDIDLYDDKVYQKAKENLDRLINKNWMIQDEKECFYIYRQKMNDHVQTGLMAAASVDDYEQSVIKKHEHTRKKKEEDRTKHVDTLDANTGPVFLTYKAKKEIDNIVQNYIENNKPVYNFKSDDGIEVEHTFWVVDDSDAINKIKNEFDKIDTLYIADGHHRSKAAQRARDLKKKRNDNHTGNEEYNYFLSVIFPHNQMYIMDYNRVVKDLNGMSKDEFIDAIKQNFKVEEFGSKEKFYKPSEKHFFGMYLDGKWYKLKAKEESFDQNDPIESLDVAILQKNLLSPILNIGNPRTDERIKFVGGIRGMKELVKLVENDGYKVAFSMYPTSIEQLMDVADANKVMPPKSTWFEPKLRSGLCVHLLK